MTSNLTRKEAQERARLLTLDTYRVSLDVSGAPNRDIPTYDSVTTVTFTAAEDATTFIDIIADSVYAVSINGQDLDPASAFDGFRVTFPVTAGHNELTIGAKALYSRSGEGMHRFFDPADDKVYLYTQYEPTDARRVFANFDQPDLKAVFEFDVTAPSDFTVLSGGAAQDSEEVAKDITRHSFAPTLRQSSYITCVCAGHYVELTDTYTRAGAGENGTDLTIPLGLYARASLADHMDPESIFTVTKQGLDFFMDFFDYPYPWGKYDQIFVPEYNLGAMENPGLVTFTDDYLFRDAVTRRQLEGRANVILHEMAHMWFGDLATMTWWDDLWLKESFADYMGGLALAEATEFDDGWVSFALSRKDWAYRQDQYPTTHPIVADIPDVEAAKLNFDGITYAKGASVLKQLVAYVGIDAFREGSRQYFRDHAYGSTTLEDFLSALDAAAPDRDVRGWAQAWLQTTGMSEIGINLDVDADGTITAAKAYQRNCDGSDVLRPHTMRVGVFTKNGASLDLTDMFTLDFDTATAEVPQLVGKPAPDLLLVNHGDDDFIKIRLDERSTATALRHVSRLADPMDRALVWSALTNAARDGLLPVTDLIEAHARSLGREDHAGIAGGMRQTVLGALDRWTADAEHPEALRSLLGSALDALATAQSGSDVQLDLAELTLLLVQRSTVLTQPHPVDTAGRQFASAVLDAELGSTLTDGADNLKIDHSLRWLALTALVTQGWADHEDIDAEAALDNTGAGALRARTARAAMPLALAKQRAFTAAVDDHTLSNDALSATIQGFTAPSALPLCEPYVEQYFERLEAFWADHSIEIARRLVLGLYPTWGKDLQRVLDLTNTWLDEHPQAPAAQRRLLVELADNQARAIRLRHAGEGADQAGGTSGA